MATKGMAVFRANGEDYTLNDPNITDEFSASTAYLVGDYVNYQGNLYVFTAEHAAGAWNAAHVNAVKLGRELESLKSAVTGTSGVVPIEMIANKYINLSGSSVQMSDGVPVLTGNSAQFSVGIYPCSEGDAFTINGLGGGQTRLWAFVDSSGNILSVSATYLTENNIIHQAPENAAWLIIHTKDGRTSFCGVNPGAMNEYNQVDILGYLPRKGATVNGVTSTWSGNVCTLNGTATAASNHSIVRYDLDPPPVQIKQGGKYLLHFKQGGGNVPMRFIWLLSDSTIERKGYLIEDTIITAPDNFVAVSILIIVPAGVTVDNYKIEPQLFELIEPARYMEDELEELKDAVSSLLPVNILPEFGNFSDVMQYGIAFDWTGTETFTVNGSSTAAEEVGSRDYIWNYADGLPKQIDPNQDYKLEFSTSAESPDVYVILYYLHIDESVTNSGRISGNTDIIIPNDCIGVSICVFVPGGATLNNVTCNIRLMTTGTATADNSGVANHISKMLSIGSSFMTGAVYPNGQFSHLSSFDNSPYGNVAIGLGIEKKNVQHILLSSTGLLYDAGRGNILTKLKSMDISPFDYVLTQYNRPDLGTGSDSGFPLGDLTSTAGDGSIVGAVLDLLAYMKTSNPTATLILVGAPPSDTRDAYAYQNVFTAVYNNGVSIGEADAMLHKLAVREHFIFIDWEDLNLSYYYKDLCYPGQVHPETDAPIRAMGLYLARQCNYTASLARTLRDENG